MSQTFDASRSLTALEQESTVMAVIEMSHPLVIEQGCADITRRR
jgi:hypothetical protein